MPKKSRSGFDPAEYRDEVEQRWGTAAYRQSNDWWRSMSDGDRNAWQRESEQLGRDWIRAAEDPAIAPDSAAAQDIARRHVAWLSGIPGTPAADPGGDVEGYVRGLADMYVADDRFAANYGGREGAEFVRAALLALFDADR